MIESYSYESLQEHYRTLVDEIDYGGWGECHYELFKAVHKRLVVLYPVLERFVQMMEDEIEKEYYVGEDCDDNDLPEASLDKYQNTLDQIFQAINTDTLLAYLKDLATPLTEPVKPVVPIETDSRKRKPELIETDDVIVVKVSKSKRIVIEILDD